MREREREKERVLYLELLDLRSTSDNLYIFGETLCRKKRENSEIASSNMIENSSWFLCVFFLLLSSVEFKLE